MNKRRFRQITSHELPLSEITSALGGCPVSTRSRPRSASARPVGMWLVSNRLLACLSNAKWGMRQENMRTVSETLYAYR